MGWWDGYTDWGLTNLAVEYPSPSGVGLCLFCAVLLWLWVLSIVGCAVEWRLLSFGCGMCCCVRW